MKRLHLTSLFLLVVVAGCRTQVDPGPGTTCESDGECDDGIDCTVDFCDVDSHCGHRPVDDLCPEGVACVPEVGCGEAPCENDEGCDDGIECTLDLCGVGGVCDHRPLDERCGDGETCTPGAGCELPSGCTSDEGCDDGIECTLDHCAVDGSCEHLAMNELCEAGERCVLGQGCLAGDCSEETELEDCDDGNFCNGVERCEPEFGCVAAAAPRDCDDNEECTIDSCDEDLNQCVYTLNSEIAGCDDFDPSVHLSGCFAIDPPVAQRCALGAVNYSFDQVCFRLMGSALEVTAGGIVLSQIPAPTDASFWVEASVAGACVEDYALSGTFTAGSAFSGAWTSSFTDNPDDATDGCMWSGCRNLTFVFNATRVSGP